MSKCFYFTGCDLEVGSLSLSLFLSLVVELGHVGFSFLLLSLSLSFSCRSIVWILIGMVLVSLVS